MNEVRLRQRRADSVLQMMKHEDILSQIPEYISGLLPASEQRFFDRHLAYCAACQRAARRERALQRLMHSTIDLATKPDPQRMQSLMPAVPLEGTSSLVWPGWQKRLAPALIILLLLFGGLFVNNIIPTKNVPAFVATAHAATATSTYTPLAPTAEALPAEEQLSEGSRWAGRLIDGAAAPEPPAAWNRTVETPDPQPTPVATVRQVLR